MSGNQWTIGNNAPSSMYQIWKAFSRYKIRPWQEQTTPDVKVSYRVGWHRSLDTGVVWSRNLKVFAGRCCSWHFFNNFFSFLWTWSKPKTKSLISFLSDGNHSAQMILDFWQLWLNHLLPGMNSAIFLLCQIFSVCFKSSSRTIAYITRIGKSDVTVLDRIKWRNSTEKKQRHRDIPTVKWFQEEKRKITLVLCASRRMDKHHPYSRWTPPSVRKM
jgi:hypothetical protein